MHACYGAILVLHRVVCDLRVCIVVSVVRVVD
jgi:hypothetical protein